MMDGLGISLGFETELEAIRNQIREHKGSEAIKLMKPLIESNKRYDYAGGTFKEIFTKPDDWGRTYAGTAAESGCRNVIEFLIDKGIEIDVLIKRERYYKGYDRSLPAKNLIELARDNGHEEMAKWLETLAKPSAALVFSNPVPPVVATPTPASVASASSASIPAQSQALPPGVTLFSLAPPRR